MHPLSPAAIWPISPTLVLALAERLGEPVDSYVNGSQVWLAACGPGDVVLEWRLHPVAAFRAPAAASHEDLWSGVVEQLGDGADPAALRLGSEIRDLARIWDGMEVFPAYDDEVEPAVLAEWATATLALPPAATGLVDHTAIADAWERSARGISIFAELVGQLSTP